MSKNPTTYTIPAKPVLEMPDRSRRDTASLIYAMAVSAITGLPEGEQKVTTEASRPPSNRPYALQTPPQTVWAREMQTELCLPQCLSGVEWMLEGLPEEDGAVASFHENVTLATCTSSYRFIAHMVAKQLAEYPDKFRVASRLPHGTFEMDMSFEFQYSRRIFTFYEHKPSLSAISNFWKNAPFQITEHTLCTFESLNDGARNVLSQIIYSYEKTESAPDRMLVALAVPPVRLHFVLIDTVQRRVTVFANAVEQEKDRNANELLTRLVEQKSWEAYWRSALWFHLVALAYNQPRGLDLHERLTSAVTSGRLPVELPAELQRACNVLDEIPVPSRWDSLCLHWSQLRYSLLELFCSAFHHALWVVLSWKILNMSQLFRITYSLNIPQTGRLNVGRSDELCRWISFNFPHCKEEIGSNCGGKRYYSYPDLKIFIKIFSSYEYPQFEAECRAFNCLSEVQGKGIPKLYESGRVSGSDEFCLIMSYEGEPLTEWSHYNQHRVEQLVGVLHKHGFHHHDVALRNVMADGRGKLTLIDFGHSVEGCTEEDCMEEDDFEIKAENQESDST